LAIPTSKATKEIDAIEKKYKELIDSRKKQTKDFEEMLKEPADVELKLVRWSQVPKGLQPHWMDGVMFMIDPDSEEPEDEKPDKKKK